MRTISTRSADKLGNFAGPHASTRDQKLRVALDVLVDLSLMARCNYFLHGASAVAEATHYTNPHLHRLGRLGVRGGCARASQRVRREAAVAVSKRTKL